MPGKRRFSRSRAPSFPFRPTMRFAAAPIFFLPFLSCECMLLAMDFFPSINRLCQALPFLCVSFDVVGCHVRSARIGRCFSSLCVCHNNGRISMNNPLFRLGFDRHGTRNVPLQCDHPGTEHVDRRRRRLSRGQRFTNPAHLHHP